jgi:hypothetical protein
MGRRVMGIFETRWKVSPVAFKTKVVHPPLPQ